ncbi:2-oxoglutarate ferredoxin oxidoreductase subunit delta [Desulfovibrio gilichinskyi]|uniref:2-oxoglutarate ferredoxin oxidoreductase subunit delta n=2 Tax=Desulfovibrio gilichinskyi TaxID=1519643 RepID=A0A1X7ERZ4_9BACT|nr:2-oxoglutarate ferredoxin oxidoreductase subunit delta [Desulfovibrio gilichinskyi]
MSPVSEETYGKITPNLDRVMSAKRKGKSKVTIFPDWCKGCGICAAFCPAKVMELNDQGKAVVVREEECINCGFCELHCPDFAIMVQPKVDDEIPARRDLLNKDEDLVAGENEESIKEKG